MTTAAAVVELGRTIGGLFPLRSLWQLEANARYGWKADIRQSYQ